METNRVVVKPSTNFYNTLRQSHLDEKPPQLYEIVNYEDVYPTVWAIWSEKEYKVVGYLRDGRLVKEAVSAIKN